MARPKKQLPPSKEKQISIRMTNDLYELLSEEAKIAHMPLTGYIRSLVTDRRPVIRQEILLNSRGLLKPLGDLGRIGSNLNQIARYLNQGGTPTGELHTEIMNCISEIYEMRDSIKKFMGST